MFGPVDCVVFVGLLFTYLFYVLSLVYSVSSTWVREAFNHLEFFAPFFFYFLCPRVPACCGVDSRETQERKSHSESLKLFEQYLNNTLDLDLDVVGEV